VIKDNEIILLVILIAVLGIISALTHANILDSILGYIIAGIGLLIFIRILKGGTIRMMKQYKCIEVQRRVEDTEDSINRLAKDGWRVVCSYAEGRWIIMERGETW